MFNRLRRYQMAGEVENKLYKQGFQEGGVTTYLNQMSNY